MDIPDFPPSVHTFCEALAYFIGARVYFWQSRSGGTVTLPPTVDRLWIAAGAIAGAALGSKVVYWLQYPTLVADNWNNLAIMLGGKTIVGGLLGGLAGVELVKWLRGIRPSTGDDFVVPLIIGMSIGRIGCLLAGLADNTYGIETNLPWAVTYSDGIPRHPAPLYEVIFLLLFWPLVAPLRRHLPRAGDTFKVFLASYLMFRFFSEFIKPPFGETHSALEQNVTRIDLYGGLVTGIQIACALGILNYLIQSTRRLQGRPWLR